MYYPRYQVTLLGVQSQNDPHIRLNPGIQHIMDENDVCYYIGFTKEEYSKVHGVSAVYTSLWQICANAAMISLSVSGVNPMDLDEHNETAQTKTFSYNSSATTLKEPEVGVIDGRPLSPQEKVKFFFPHSDSVGEDLSEVVGRGSRSPMYPQPSSADFSRQNEARRGLQLLRYHSRVDVHAMPVVRVNLLHPEHTQDRSSLSLVLPSCPLPPVTEETCLVPRDPTHFTFDLSKAEEGDLPPTPPNSDSKSKEGVSGLFDDNQVPLTPRSPFQRSFSDERILPRSTEEEEVKVLRKGGAVYSSDLSLVGSQAQLSVPSEPHLPLSFFHRLASSSRMHSSGLSLTQVDENEVCFSTVCLRFVM